MNYLMDANTYIQAKNEYYNMDVFPGYWVWLDTQFELGNIASVSMVYNELISYGDKLSSWIKLRKEHFIDVSDDDTQTVFGDIMSFISDGDYTVKDRDVFSSGADPWLIAKASVINATVVTLESMVPGNSKKVKIPNICKQFDVEFINTFRLLRLLEARFLLEK